MTPISSARITEAAVVTRERNDLGPNDQGGVDCMGRGSVVRVGWQTQKLVKVSIRDAPRIT